MICSHLLSFDNINNFPRSRCIYIAYNLDFDANRSRVMSFVFKSKIVILFLTRSKRINSRHASTSYAGFLAGHQIPCRSRLLVHLPSVPNHGVSSTREQSSICSEESRMRLWVRRSSLCGRSLSKSAALPAYIVVSVGQTVSPAVPGLEAAGGTAYREILSVDQSRKTMRAAAARSGFPP